MEQHIGKRRPFLFITSLVPSLGTAIPMKKSIWILGLLNCPAYNTCKYVCYYISITFLKEKENKYGEQDLKIEINTTILGNICIQICKYAHLGIGGKILQNLRMIMHIKRNGSTTFDLGVCISYVKARVRYRLKSSLHLRFKFGI